MTDNLKLWAQFEDIDPAFTKPITGKDYKGTSPNAHYVVKCLTEMFGPIGQGFGWTVLKEDIERFGDTAIHWCRIEFWHTDRSNVFESYGQTKMAYMTRGQNSYLKVDEDAPKKSLTDAVTKAAAQIGIASNIFLGRWDDSKYVDEVAAEYREKEPQSPPSPAQIAQLKSALLGAVNGAPDMAKLSAIEGDNRFDADLQKLRDMDGDAAQEVIEAIEAKKSELKPKAA